MGDYEGYRPVLENFNNRPDLVFVVNRFNYIEYVINEIIVHYVDPDQSKKEFVRSIWLNTAITSFGAKLKLFAHMNAVENWIEITPYKLHRFVHIRNQFVHSEKKVIEINLGKETDECDGETILYLESVTSKGQLEQVNSEKALKEFTEIFAELKEKLHDALSQVKGDHT